LRFYALFKQATVGPCNVPKPGMLEFVAKAKWQAWKDLSVGAGMTKDTAVATYVAELEKIAPSWQLMAASTQPQRVWPSAAASAAAAAHPLIVACPLQ